MKKDVPTPDDKHPCERTVSNWVKEAGILYKEFMDNVVSPRVTGSISADEKYSTERGMETWNYTVMDIESRYIINHESSPTKQNFDGTELFASAKECMGKEPADLITDMLHGLATGAENSLPGTAHKKDAAINKVHMHNNKHERFNGTYGDRLDMAKWFNSPDPALHNIFFAFYNLLRPHMGIDEMTPAEKLGVIVEGKDKMMTILKYAAVHYG